MQDPTLLDFKFRHHPVRVILFENHPWILLNDIKEILDYQTDRDLIKLCQRHLCEVRRYEMETLLGPRLVSVADTFTFKYALTNSRRTLSMDLRDWLIDEVIPQLKITDSKTELTDSLEPYLHSDPVKEEKPTDLDNLIKPYRTLSLLQKSGIFENFSECFAKLDPDQRQAAEHLAHKYLLEGVECGMRYPDAYAYTIDKVLAYVDVVLTLGSSVHTETMIPHIKEALV